jgi:hypothetical protein
MSTLLCSAVRRLIYVQSTKENMKAVIWRYPSQDDWLILKNYITPPKKTKKKRALGMEPDPNVP